MAKPNHRRPDQYLMAALPNKPLKYRNYLLSSSMGILYNSLCMCMCVCVCVQFSQKSSKVYITLSILQAENKKPKSIVIFPKPHH